MTHVYDDPAAFKDDVLVGFAAAYPGYVQRVPDASGFVRAGGPLEGKVSLVVGGGSGHYPSYSGVVGTGFADGAVLGDLFASPSAEQVYRVCRAAHGGAGVVMGFGNYAGDRLNFKVAADRLGGRGHRRPDRLGHRRHRLGLARRAGQAPRHRRARSPSTRSPARPPRPGSTSTRSSA